MLAIRLLAAGPTRPDRHEGQVVGGRVASLPPPHLHQAPLGVPSLVVRLQDANQLSGPEGDFVVSSGGEVVGRDDLEVENKGRFLTGNDVFWIYSSHLTVNCTQKYSSDMHEQE